MPILDLEEVVCQMLTVRPVSFALRLKVVAHFQFCSAH